MHKFIGLSLSSLLIFYNCCFANDACQENFTENPKAILGCYLQQAEPEANPYLLSYKYHEEQNVWEYQYIFTSQVWPKLGININDNKWLHNLSIFMPAEITTKQALLFVNGGTRNPQPNAINPKPYQINFARIANTTSSIVVDLQDVPNEYLTFDDGIPRKEDGIIAYTWKHYLSDPEHSYFWPGQLPMVKAVIKAMDVIQILMARKNITINHFVVSGASKRGWATWLSALMDERVNAIVPVVIDILNTKKNLALIYESYNHRWPVAFHDYTEQKVTDYFNTTAFDQLINMQDPITFLTCDHCQTYQQRLNIPKYIISAGGDDFFVPDSLNTYIHYLPGETLVRMVPNQKHRMEENIVEDALLVFYKSIVSGEERPHITWSRNEKQKTLQITTSVKPKQVLLWEAVNPKARDFRLAYHTKYQSRQVKENCDPNTCTYVGTIPNPSSGFKAFFIEATFEKANGETFLLTTPAFVVGKE